MTEEKYTRCPSCKTVFRVTDAQLALRDGMVRCGHCQTIFDGPAEMISLAPAAAGDENVNDEALLGPPTVTLRSSRALEPAPHERGEPSVQIEPRLMQDEHGAEPAFASTEPAIVDEGEDDEVPDVDYANRFAWDKPKAQKPRHAWLYAIASVLLVLLLAVQLLYHFRDAIAAHWPATRPVLAGMCATLGCSVRPLRDVGALSIDASDLQVDPAHKGLLILTATVRNRAAYALAYPHLELTLTDGQDQMVVRRAFPPAEYLGGTVDVRSGLAGNGEAVLKLFIDASATTQAGYRLYLFYP
ncbi:MAG: DUF3426 domain-containing protein [Casimicrobiaceae bacterium]